MGVIHETRTEWICTYTVRRIKFTFGIPDSVSSSKPFAVTNKIYSWFDMIWDSKKKERNYTFY